MSMLKDGFKALITMAGAPTIKLYEKEITPPAVSAGGPIDTTTMRNTAWRTMDPKSLKSLGQVTANCGYDPAVYDTINAQIGVNQLFTVTFAGGSNFNFYGWIDSFTPSSLKEGEMPMASVVIQPSLRNAAGVETAPDWHEVGSGGV